MPRKLKVPCVLAKAKQRFDVARRHAILPAAIALVIGWLDVTSAQSPATRTYVSGLGRDTQSCSAQSPCKTFQAALAKTAAGGQIYVLDSAEYGPITITKSISIIAGGKASGILAAAGASGITVAAGPTDTVTLEGLSIDGAGSGTNGVLFTSGASLTVKNSVIRGFQTGLAFEPSALSALSVEGARITNNTTGISIETRAAVATRGVLSDVQVVGNGVGVSAKGQSTGETTVLLQLCLVSNNDTVGIRSAGYSVVVVANCDVSNNTLGLEATNTGAALRVAGTSVAGNGTGSQTSNGGQITSAQSNFSPSALVQAAQIAPPASPLTGPTADPFATWNGTNEPADISTVVDIPPAAILYAGFNDGIITTSPINLGTSAVLVAGGRLGQGLSIPSSALSTANPVLQNRRGTVAFWIRLDASGNVDNVLSQYPGPPYWTVSAKSGPSGELAISFAFDGAAGGTGSVEDVLSSDQFSFVAGNWHHFAWTWQGTHHRLYRDGTLVADKVMVSPMPILMRENFRIGGGGAGAATLDELAVYNFAFNSTDVVAAYQAASSAPINPTSTSYGTDAVAQWAPGLGKVLIMADAGNKFATRTKSYLVTVLRDGSPVASGTVSNLDGGFGQALIPLSAPFPAGTYMARVELKDSSGITLATQTTASFTVPATTWLGNNLGIPAAGSVQAPWTPIVVNGTTLSVWARTYGLSGGWGLPQQITSLGENLLAAPVDVDFDIGSGKFNLTPQSLTITSAANDVVTWQGTATGNGINATINGSLEYDGMLLIKMTLAPISNPVVIRSMKLQTAMPAARAKFHTWAATSSPWGIAYNPMVPTTPGTFLSNTYAGLGNKSPGKSRLLPSIVLSDDDKGLEWFADNLAGWSVDQSITSNSAFQSLIVDQNTNVRLENSFATETFTLNAPTTITFGYMATPVKPRPSDWRAVQIGISSGGGPNVPNLFTMMWTWPGDGIRRDAWRAFALTPGQSGDIGADTALVASRSAPIQGNGIYLAPFVNQHIMIAPSTSSPNDTMTVLGLLSHEVGNPDGSGSIGYVSMPTRGVIDYWIASIHSNLTAGIVDGIYIDEPFYSWQASAALLSGNGFTDQMGINRVGYNSLGVRTQLKRLRQLFIDHGKRPSIWINASTGYVAPHMWSFAEYISDGEGMDFALGIDFVDRWGGINGLNWLRANSRSAKYGFTPIFFDYISSQIPSASLFPYYRSMVAVLQLMDINVQGHGHLQWAAYMQPRVDFGITAADVTFTGFWSNNEIVANSDVPCSYYKGNNRVLAHCANLTDSGYNGTISFNAGALGLTGTVVAKDAESGSPITITNSTLPISIGRHDYRVIVLTGS